jgi:succinoglycan biosynthesis protein ExoM
MLEDTGKVARIAVTICICTFRRRSVVAALESVAQQAISPGLLARIIVVDNDVTPSAWQPIREFCATARVQVDYVHAPGRNISIARNAALDKTTTPWLAFLDDDEFAAPNWLTELLDARDEANAVFGPCQAIYPENTPTWVRAGDYHSTRVEDPEAPISTGYAGNALIDMDFVRRHKLRFDPALGRTGGEDTMFFHHLYRKGGILKYASRATVFEPVDASRLSPQWILRRKFRSGQLYGKMHDSFKGPVSRRVLLSTPFKIAACLGMSAITAPLPHRAMWWLMRGTFHSGVLGYLMGARLLQPYGEEP